MTWRGTRALILLLSGVLFIHAGANDAVAYLKFGVSVGSRTVILRWNQTPVRYFVINRSVPNVDVNAFATVMGRAFATWQDVPTASVTYQFAGFTGREPGSGDGVSTLGFQAAPELDRVLASTSFFIDTISGELIESDIFFNSIFSWSASTAAEAGRHDLQSIAVHEIGHMSGLGHSMIGETEMTGSGSRRVLAAESVMFPIAYPSGNVLGRTLRADDIAGISDVYSDGAFRDDTGSISGRVTKNGQGVFGAHVVAFNPATGKLTANFTLSSQGTFSIAGLSPGPHVIRVEPIDDADVDSFFDVEERVDINFRGAYHEQMVVAPRGGDSGAIEVRVQPK